MSVGVTEPKSVPLRPGVHVEAELSLPEGVRDLLGLLEGSASWRARTVSRFSSSATLAGVAHSASRRGSR